MAVYLLIDTNIWKRLVSKNEFSYHLKQLDHWVTQRHANLLVPDALTSEWAKRRELEKEAIETALRDHQEEARLRKIFQDFSAEFIQQKIDDIRRSLRSQLDIIDRLLDTKATKIDTPPSVHAMISTQRKANKMPFWNTKKDHTNDAVVSPAT